MSDQPFVYAIQAGGKDGPIKIGWALWPETRLAELQIGNAAELRIIGVVEADQTLERALHRRLRPYRIRGEWFKACPEVLQALKDEQFGSRPDRRMLAGLRIADWNGKRCVNCEAFQTVDDDERRPNRDRRYCAACDEFAMDRDRGVDPFEEAA